MSTVPFNRPRTAPLTPDLVKRLPSNIDAERSILGAILLDNGAIKDADDLRVDDLFLGQHQVIFKTMLALALAQVSAGHQLDHCIDLVTLTEALHAAGQLEPAGGAPYLAALPDGMPRISNVKHYVKIVKDKAIARRIIHLTHAIQLRAFEEENPEQVLQLAEAQLKEIVRTPNENPSVVVGFKSLLNMTLPDLEYSIEPLLTTGGTGEIYGWRGTGKSLVATQMSLDLAAGRPTIFPGDGGPAWPVSRRYRMLYVYGEMHGAMIKSRACQLAEGCGYDVPDDEFFGTMCKDFQKAWRPNISTPRNRKIIEERIFTGGYEGVIFDNISTLWPTSQEDEGDRTAVLTEWFIDLNQHGVWVIYLHHAGKSGEQRGSSEKEDMLDFVLKLRTPHGYKRKEGLRVTVENEKNRGECKQPRWLIPFELSLISERGAAVWVTRKGRNAQLEAAFALFHDGGKSGDAQFDLKISRATAFRYYKKYQTNGNVQHWMDDTDED
jgi:DnaB-like helicase N terminal domain/AAA domain